MTDRWNRGTCRSKSGRPLQVRPCGIRFLHGADLQAPGRVAGPLEPRMGARDEGTLVEHQARVLLGLREEARQVPAIGERGRLPLDALPDPVIRPQDDLADAPG